LGCDAVELDVFRLKDDTLVAFHGAGTDELGGSLANHIQDTESFNQKRNIQDLTWEEVQNECNFLQNSPCLPCPEEAIRHGRIPKLEQVLQMAKTSGLHLKIELKGPKTVEPTIDLIEGYDMVDQCSFASFRPDHVALVSQLEHERFQSQEPPKPCHYQRGLLFAGSLPEDFLQQALDVGATEVHLRYDTCTPKRVDRIHQAGLRSMAWFRGPVAMSQQEYADVGNEDAEMYETVMATGVNQICVNRPDIVLGILNNATK
jgi:glycerophosphoryl diester phosphodiesterase